MEIEKLKQKILDLAIRGKLVPQDPNDEPASVLIDRIRAEKEELIKQGKIKRSKEDSYIYKGSDNCYYEKVGNKSKKINEKFVFEIPANWQWTTLGTIFNIISSKRIHKSDWRVKGVPFYRARDLDDVSNGIFKSDIYIEPSLYEQIKKCYGVPCVGDILVSAVGTLGRTYVVKNKNPFYYKDGNIICLNNCYGIDPFYIQYIFQSNLFMNQISEESKGTTVDTFTIIHANHTYIPLPPLNEQKRIVERLNILLKKTKDIEIQNTLLKSDINLLKSKILDDIFGENTRYKSYYEKRTKTTLEKLVRSENIGDGDWVLSENMNPNGNVKLVQLKHIGKNVFLNKPFCHVDKDFFTQNNCKEIKEGYLLINRLVANEMTCCILPQMDEKCITAVDVCWIAPDSHYNLKYLMYYLSSNAFQQQVLMKCSGSTRKRISKTNLIKIEFNIHPLNIQERIVEDIENYFNILDKMSNSN